MKLKSVIKLSANRREQSGDVSNIVTLYILQKGAWMSQGIIC